MAKNFYMEALAKTGRLLGVGLLGAGIFGEFCLYDGELIFHIFQVDSFLSVDAGTRGLIFDKIRGVQETVIGEGTHIRIPFIQVSLYILVCL